MCHVQEPDHLNKCKHPTAATCAKNITENANQGGEIRGTGREREGVGRLKMNQAGVGTRTHT